MGCVFIRSRVQDFGPDDGLGLIRKLHLNCAIHPNIEVLPSLEQRKKCRPSESAIFMCGDDTEAAVCQCRYLADLLCDYPMGKGKTCDAPLCAGCRVKQVGDNFGLDFCLAHHILAPTAPTQHDGDARSR